MSVVGLFLQIGVFRHMVGQELRQTLVTIGKTYQFDPPDWLYGAIRLPLVRAYPIYRLALLGASIVIGIALWLFLNRTRVGMMIRAGVDDRVMLSVAAVNVRTLFVGVFAIGGALAGVSGVIGGSALPKARQNMTSWKNGWRDLR